MARITGNLSHPECDCPCHFGPGTGVDNCHCGYDGRDERKRDVYVGTAHPPVELKIKEGAAVTEFKVYGTVHKAGPELDALVAEKVMGWRHTYDGDVSGANWGIWVKLDETEIHDDELPKFSTDIAAAWLVADKAKGSMGFRVEVDGHGGWKAGPLFPGDFGEAELYPQHEASADTAALAICRAVLKKLEDVC